MGSIRTAWDEDRRSTLGLLIILVVLASYVVTAHTALGWVAVAFWSVLAAWHAVLVFVVRPRRLARTGSRDKPGWLSRW